MPAKLSPILYGSKKNIDFSKFNIGNVIKAVTYDLEEFGEKGVQGVVIKSSDALKLVKYHQADKHKTGVDDPDSDYGSVTGNLLLCAHGAPKTKPGRVIGTEFAGKKPSQICDLLTKNKDKKKNLSKDYSGKITLSGCFTASGGPEKDKQDDAFAKKVKDELTKRGYKKVSVVGMPGPSWTARSKDGSDRDGDGKVMKRGDKGVWAKSEEMLEAQEKKAVKLRKEIDSMTKKIVGAWNKSDGDKSAFLSKSGVKKALNDLKSKEKALDDLKAEIKSIKKDMKKTGDVDGKDIKALTGTFGLRVIKSEIGA